MNLSSDILGELVIFALGIYCIFRGIMTITTGKLAEREEARLRDYSEAGLKRYKLLSSVMNIVGGLVCIAISVLKLTNLMNTGIFKIVALIVIVLMIAIYIIVRNSCKNV